VQGKPAVMRAVRAASLTGVTSEIGVVLIQVILIRGSRSVGSHDVFGHGPEIPGFERTFIAEPTARTMHGQRPPVIDQSADERQLLAAQESIAYRSPSLRILLRFHISAKPRSRLWHL
jgi:hypothetical protein